MDSAAILRDLFGAGKLSTVATSLKMGRNRSYLSAYIARGNAPSADLLAEIADAIGYDLIMRNRSDGSEITINPPTD